MADHRRLDGYRPAAAERVDQRAVGPPEAEQHKPGREGLLQRRRTDERAIPALVQAGARGVDGEAGDVLEQRDLDDAGRPGLIQRLDVVGRAELFDEGLLDDPLAGRHAGKLRRHRPPQHGKRRRRADPLLPRKRVRAVEKLAEVPGLELPDLDQHAIGAPQPEVRPAHSQAVTDERDPPGLDDPRAVPKVLQLPGGHGLQAHRRRRD